MTASTGLTPTQVTVNSLTANQDYIFAVSAHNAVGWSAQSSTLTVVSASTPSAPGTPFRVGTTSQTQVVVGWTAETSNGGSPVTAYEVWYNQGSIINTFVLYSSVNSATFQEIITTVSAGDAYTIKIRGQNRVGYSSYTQTMIYAATVPDAPNAPTRVSGSNTLTTITLTWTANGDGGLAITNYEIWWNGGGAGPVTGLLQSTGSTSTTYVATGLSSGTYYSFAIKADNIVGTSSLSTSTSIICATVPDAPTSLTLVSQSTSAI
jgi:cellulose 1,4-beta-cellobiosidase